MASRIVRSGVALAIAALALGRAAAAAAEAGYQQGRAGFGAWTVPVPLSVQAQNDLAPGEGMYVMRVRPGSTAAGLGVQPGDIITTLNDRPIASRGDIRAVVRAATPGDEATANVIHDGGGAQRLGGEFLARQPRPRGGWGGGFAGLGPEALAALGMQPRWWDESGDGLTPTQRQQAELLAERAAIADAAAELARMRAALPRREGAWVASFAMSVGDDAAAP